MGVQGSGSIDEHFVGSVTVGERGQVVIPSEARKRLGIETGDKLLAFAHPTGLGLMLVRVSAVEEFVEVLRESLRHAQQAQNDPEEVNEA
jgi:AbrB family looped-hinge helix DNA binding protein